MLVFHTKQEQQKRRTRKYFEWNHHWLRVLYCFWHQRPSSTAWCLFGAWKGRLAVWNSLELRENFIPGFQNCSVPQTSPNLQSTLDWIRWYPSNAKASQISRVGVWQPEKLYVLCWSKHRCCQYFWITITWHNLFKSSNIRSNHKYVVTDVHY